ncbi:MAG TPA: molybdopterin cofactor-binding domain-containing protein [Acidiferrobacterales bacterium]|nr:molybdopterin cofactor-binding domain-containing protein [Acidiferrobacterales bacterium]
MTESDLERRQFLKLTTAAGGGLLIGFHLPGLAAARDGYRLGGQHFSPNSWIHLAPDDTVTLMVATSELGQGSLTAIPMLLAEELEADWAKVKVALAPVNADFNNPLSGRQSTGGSTAVRGYWEPLRRVGAGARELLIAAAAKTWGVAASACHARNSTVIHTAYGQWSPAALWCAARRRQQAHAAGRSTSQGPKELPPDRPTHGASRHARQGQRQRAVRRRCARARHVHCGRSALPGVRRQTQGLRRQSGARSARRAAGGGD